MIHKTYKLLMLGLTISLLSGYANAMMMPGNHNYHGPSSYQQHHYYPGPFHHRCGGFRPFHHSRIIIIKPGFYGPGLVVRRW